MQEELEKVQDFRVKGRCLHKLRDILGLVLYATIADCDDLSEIVDYGKAKQEFLQEKMGLEFLNGIPSEDTINRVMCIIKPEELSKAYKNCIEELSGSLVGKQIAIDGKELRGTIPSGKKHALVRMVNAWVCENQISFGQVKVSEKSNEITAIPKSLEMVDCEGSIVTIDAIGCQKEIIKTIRKNKAEYVIAVKKNQKDLYEEINDFIEKRVEKTPFYRSLDKDHGRGEERKVYVYPCLLEYISEAKDWQDINTIAMVERIRIQVDKTEIKRTFYISSLKEVGAEFFAKIIRSHWGIENNLHWQLDFTFGEDNSQIRNGNAPVNLHLIRKWSLTILKNVPSKISIKRKRKQAARDNQFLLDALALS